MLSELRALGAGPEIIDASPLKVRAAWGETACRILLFCADAALLSKGFKWGKPVYKEESNAEAITVEDDDGDGEDIDEAAAISDEEDIEDDVLFSASLSSPSKRRDVAIAVLHSSVDPSAWRAELERVAPRLRAPIPLGGGSMLPGGGGGGGGGGLGGALSGLRGGGRGSGVMNINKNTNSALGEWRGHLEATSVADSTVLTLLSPAFESLRRLTSELSEVAAIVGARETALNSEFSSLISEHGVAASDVATLGSGATAVQLRVTSLTSELAAVSEALDEVQGAMEERGSSLSDSSPLIQIKAALSSLRGDIKDLDVQLGVQGHSVMQMRLLARHKAQQKAREDGMGKR